MTYPNPNAVVPIVVSTILTLFFLYFVSDSLFRCIHRRKFRTMDKLVILVALSAVIMVLSDIIYHSTVTSLLTYEIGVAVFPMIVGLKTNFKEGKSMSYGFAVFGISIIVMLLRIAVPVDTEWFSSLFFCLPVLAVLAMAVLFYMEFLYLISDRAYLIKAATVRLKVSNDANNLYVFAFLAVMFLQMTADDLSMNLGYVVFAICLLCSLALFLLCYLRMKTDRVFVIDRKKEGELQEMLEVCANESREAFKVDQTYRAIYDRVVIYFEKEKPYLDADLNALEVARKTFCNKLYLSRAINLYTGRNYCQYVNYYRIRHAVKLFEEDDTLKVHQWAEQCGFRTVASFSMAFKLYMNESPGEWCRRRRGDDGYGGRSKKVKLEQ